MNASGILNYYVESTHMGMQHEEANMFVLHALLYVIREVLAQLSPTLVIMASTRDKMMSQWFEHMLENLISTLSDTAVQVLNIDGPSHVRVPGRKYSNLMLVDSYDSLL